MEKQPIFIIAEAGDNHNGSFKNALKLVDKAVEAEADCVKFQTFITERVISKYAEMADYQKENTRSDKSQYEMVKELELSFDKFRKIKNYCDSKNIMFLSTPFDLESIEFLEELDLPFWKIPSGEITNLPYLEKIARTKKPVILSTGMCNMDEISEALRILKENGTKSITLLQCNTEYPTPIEDVNLRAMKRLSETFNIPVGYSDHTVGIEVSIAAAALGAVVLEKHFTLDKNMEGPDHKASLEPDEFSQMVKCVRKIEKALGSSEKKMSKSEEKNKSIARKSIVAKKDIKKGEVYTPENLDIKRPGTGISPMCWYKMLGQKAGRDYGEDELIENE